VTARVSARLVKSFLRYLRERLGEAACDAVLAEAPLGAIPEHGWIAVEPWVATLERFEARHGERATWRLLREATRVTMAVAISKGWSAFLADATPESLLGRADTFWKLSYDAGTMVVASKRPRHVVLAIDGWPDAPDAVGAMVAEACAVFLARLGERAPRAIASAAGGRVEIDVSW
jgi:hypothetical protein